MAKKKDRTIGAVIKVYGRTFQRLHVLADYLSSLGPGRRVTMGEVVDWLCQREEVKAIVDDDAAVKTNG